MGLQNPHTQPRDQIEAVYRAESRRVFATLVRLLGDFDLAEEALHDAFASAIEQWPREGLPENPRAWLASAGGGQGGQARRGGAAAGATAGRRGGQARAAGPG